MITTAAIIRPKRLEGLNNVPHFISTNNQQQLIEVDLGFKNNPYYKQEKCCLFLPFNIYYQKLVIADGRANAVKDDARSIVITGQFHTANSVEFEIEIYPALPVNAGLKTDVFKLPFFPEINTELIAMDDDYIFYHFSINKIIYRTGKAAYLQLRYLGNYYNTNIVNVLKKWHPENITALANIPHR